MSMRRKFESGAATNYIARRQALRKLQLSLRDFRRLCIIKGIHPHQPKHIKKANKGSSKPRTFYFAKDIQFLSHEPLINKFRDFKVYLKRARRARSTKEYEECRRLAKARPVIEYDHVVKERYPSFADALQDMEDALCLLFLFSKLRKNVKIPSRMPHMCRRLTVEFMHYVIHTRALRKVFVSIKGIYYQVEIMGQVISWITPHDRVIEDARGVDMSIMVTFVDFYMTMVGFVNFKLYKSIQLFYPPQLGRRIAVEGDHTALDKELEQEVMYSLCEKLMKHDHEVAEEESILDEFLGDESGLDEKAVFQRKMTHKVQQLFNGLKFFLSREVPRESLTFVIRACGGQVSWDSTVEYGSTYPETDENITHQIVDRPSVKISYTLRIYVQPQWVYDCINTGTLLPVQDYLYNSTLPPHLSPFVDEKEGDYIPQERIKFLQLQGKNVTDLLTTDDVKDANCSIVNKIEEAAGNNTGKKSKKKRKVQSKLSVVPSAPVKPTVDELMQGKTEERKLQEIMIPKKYRRVYKKIKFGQKRKAAEVRALMKKRKAAQE